MENKTQISKRKIKFYDIEDNPSFVKIEKDLITLGFFSIPKYRNGKKHPKQEKIVKILTIEEDGVEARTEILTHPKYGLPTTGDLTKYLAFLKIVHENYKFGKIIQNPIEFTHYELLKKANIEPNKERYQEVTEWLERLYNTTLKFYGEMPVISADKTSWAKIFDKLTIAGTVNEFGVKEKYNTVFLSDWAKHNICERPLVPIDFETYQKLKNDVAKLLVVHLQVWLYASQKRNCFEKTYQKFCQLLDLKEQQSEGRIKRQLTPAFEELKKYEYVSNWKIEKGNRDLKIKIYHGSKFQRDLKRALFVVKEPEELIFKPSSKSNLSSEQKELSDYLISLGIFPSLAEKLITKFDLEKLRLRTTLALRKLKEKGQEIDSPGGYLYSLLNTEEDLIETKNTFTDLPRDEIHQEIIEKETVEYLKKTKRFEEHCFVEGLKIIPITYDLYFRDFEKGQEIWKNITLKIEKKLNSDIFDSWFKPLIYGGMIDKSLILLASEVNQDWVETYYGNLIESLMKEEGNYKINFINSYSWIGAITEADNPELAYRLFCINYFQNETGLTWEKYNGEGD